MSKHQSPLDESFVKRVEALQNLQKDSVQAIGASLAPQFRRQVARLLGGLNSIGAIRSGGAEAGTRRLTEEFTEGLSTRLAGKVGDQFGTAFQLEDLAFRKKQEADRRKSEFFSGIGKFGARLVGGIIAGNPIGSIAQTVLTGQVATNLVGDNQQTGKNMPGVGVSGKTEFRR